MTPRLFGTSANDPSQEVPEELASLVLTAQPDELRLIAHFFNDCADDIEANGASYEHRHLKDEPVYQNSTLLLPDIQVSRCV